MTNHRQIPSSHANDEAAQVVTHSSSSFLFSLLSLQWISLSFE